MFCNLLGRKFSNRCKHSVKCIKCRMETIRKKKQAMVRFLKKDVADLISGGHDTNAFGRLDALIVEVNQSSCYDIIEQYCFCIMEHLPTMQKERVCPEETVEAIATLIFAAARFPDLPELADLRKEFTKRYGTQMEAYINEEFVEKMQKKTFPQDKKLQLMQDIAHEFSIHWDFKAFEHKISNPSDQPKTQLPSYQLSDLQKKQLKPVELINTENIKENQKIIQMRRRYEHHHHNSTEKINKSAADELENTQSPQFEAPLNAKTKFSRDFNGSSANQGERISEVVKEKNNIVQWNQPDRTMNLQTTKTFNLNPPYLKPKVSKNASLDISNGGYYLMNPPFSIKRASTYAVSTVEDANLLDQIPIKQAGIVGRKNSMNGDDNYQKIFISMSSEQEEDDATNGAIRRRRRLQRAFINRPWQQTELRTL